MASSLYSFLLALSIVYIFVAPTHSTSRTALNHRHEAKVTGFQIMLEHVDSGKNLTKFQLLERAIERGSRRLQRLEAMLNGPSGVETSVYAGDGEYLMNLSIGTPAQPFSAIMDTGSDLIWTQCQPCTQCFNQSTPIFNPQGSSSFSTLPCSSQLCQALSSPTCSNNFCQYTYGYGDGSETQGSMGTETLTFGSVSIPNITFGCGENNQGFGQGNGAGLVGMGRGPLSLPSQLDVTKFSYCMTPIGSSTPSNLLLGSLANSVTAGSPNTTLIQSSQIPTFYYITLNGLSVGSTRLPIDPSAFALNSNNGTGGIIIDSGTTLTYFVNNAYQSVRQEFISQINLPVVNGSSSGFDLCFQTPSDPSNLQIPTFVMHFDGGDLELPSENYFISPSNGLICLAMGSSSQGMSIFGNIQQQNMLVVYDTGNSVVSFASAQCGAS
uniref:Aspartic proteinase nepenthesin-1 n=1 Tax=Nepenthes gracilis TaxID=150966 RepID=NEP1_NEPGR|nr:RecName: Full=Aspartic proteinase nepenthesin-1; AltName: Full=Nepenthesin-I; Flags: Precursor [Nepenthes gracilis]BAD07474.1 aspartic proteinase nepenthesin I [Nepenthes gracilis]